GDAVPPFRTERKNAIAAAPGEHRHVLVAESHACPPWLVGRQALEETALLLDSGLQFQAVERKFVTAGHAEPSVFRMGLGANIEMDIRWYRRNSRRRASGRPGSASKYHEENFGEGQFVAVDRNQAIGDMGLHRRPHRQLMPLKILQKALQPGEWFGHQNRGAR